MKIRKVKEVKYHLAISERERNGKKNLQLDTKVAVHMD